MFSDKLDLLEATSALIWLADYRVGIHEFYTIKYSSKGALSQLRSALLKSTLGNYGTPTLGLIVWFSWDVLWGSIFSCVRPSYEQAVSDLDRSMHISLRA
jgi:hypothetical protein